MQLPPLTEARLLRRYKRFLADVDIPGVGLAVAHCPNPGAMTGLAARGARCWLSRHDSPTRKLSWTLEIVEADGVLVGINTNLPNALAEEAIHAGVIAELSGYEHVRREAALGANSRIDFLMEGEGWPRTWVEVKNVHLMRQPGLAEFPDSVTARGAKHLAELAARARAGERAVQLFVIQRADCERFSIAGDIDPAYQRALASALSDGVEALAYACDVSVEAITLARPVELVL
ncbi:DNA/RNA nuclease SfsA [Alkalicaulis satelles]|uniref:Sugar fermentation stimulation protein homolog n=1 Tax=Alkalicaulis satelles TaxID=2609175 RepID=A0A5M6ZAF7_9PROT|nr:DNA/RNA nuclease SfsA [Alkalicaulis satelles]KAA5801686.1 DNA/RNA nuclease SfsA [Alkalicaulis satelles]